jgi:NNP family nitrate/nitrite transporter-like MFS transporter
MGEETTRTRMLALATVGFLVCFWAWALISPLGPTYAKELGLTPVQQSLLVAVPVVVGSLGRIPVGALTDRLGARVMFPAVAGLTILPVLFVGIFGTTYAALLVGGFFLGIGGTAFAVGVPFVNAWFPPDRRGTAIGIFGAGMGGTAVSAFTTVAIADHWGRRAPFMLVAVVLAVYAVVARLTLRDAPGRTPATGSFMARAWRTFRRPVTLKLSLLYAIGFGGFVAFSVYLPTYLKNAYALTQSDAATKMGGFVLVAVLLRPVGGFLADRIPAAWVLAGAFAVVAVAALGQAATPSLAPAGTVTFLTMAGALGAAAGAVFALVAQRAPRPQVGAVTGVVGAAGGLGGFIPPLIMGSIYGSLHSYALGLIALSVVAAAATIYAAVGLRAPHSAVGP